MFEIVLFSKILYPVGLLQQQLKCINSVSTKEIGSYLSASP